MLADRFIVPTVPSFEYPRSDLPPNVRFVGRVRPQLSRHYFRPDWWSELHGERPVVHVTQGIDDDDDPSRLIEPTIRALRDDDVFVVVSTGGRDVAARIAWSGAGIDLGTDRQTPEAITARCR